MTITRLLVQDLILTIIEVESDFYSAFGALLVRFWEITKAIASSTDATQFGKEVSFLAEDSCSEGIHLIAITQSFNAGDSFGSDELLKHFTQVGLFRQDEDTRAKKLIQFGRSSGELAEREFKALIT